MEHCQGVGERLKCKDNNDQNQPETEGAFVEITPYNCAVATELERATVDNDISDRFGI